MTSSFRVLMIRQAKNIGAKLPVKVKYDTADGKGRTLDLHSLHTTLGTRLARDGVAPQLAQQPARETGVFWRNAAR